ncbi:MAG: MBL fold metallo-hydrolase [Desulfocapsaceae bacterium]|nr:MBL fold metallo-hydrolase [Desulfocapsaceae bacterium]
MHVTFMGAVREVTGSMHLVCTEEDKVLLDCGMFQGRRKEASLKNRVMPIDPSMLTNMVLSHAHIDHSGRIPLLTRKDFGGRIFCTRATADACAFLLPDSAKIQESDAQYLNYKIARNILSRIKSGNGGTLSPQKMDEIKKLLKNGVHGLNNEEINKIIAKFDLNGIEPLYSCADAEQSLGSFEGIPYRREVTIGRDLTCRFYEAGHILGSAMSILKYRGNGQSKTLCYSGDIGRFSMPIIRDPALDFAPEDRQIDLLIMESTYGNRVHEPVEDLKPRLKRILNETIARGGTVLIPSFAYGRTQELLYILHELYDEGSVAKVPVWVDSPLAANITTVFGQHPEVYDQDTHDTFLSKGKNPFSFGQVNFIRSVEESIDLTREERPHIVISASGMCEAGRILHHLRYKIHNEKNTILIVGYMAEHTLGRRILEEGKRYQEAGRKGDAPLLRFFNKEYPLRARVEKIGGFSAHGDKNDMLRFLQESNLAVKKIAIVHGDEDQSLAFSDFLAGHGYAALVPRRGETITV